MGIKHRWSRCWMALAVGAVAFLAVMAVVAPLSSVILGEQRQGPGAPHDWTHHHLIFSDPGTFADATKNGSFVRWYRTVTDQRFNLQRLKRPHLLPISFPRWWRESDSLQGDWNVSLNAAGAAAAGTYPAKYSFNTNSPSCYSGTAAGQGQVGGDFVVFGVDAAGASGTQANLVGISNLYPTGTSGTGLCGATGPTVEFSYYVGTGTVQTSPVLSLDGKEVAFVETVAGGSKFHTLTLGTTGTNGAAANAPMAPGTGNNAVNSSLTMSGNVNVTRSSVWVVYDSMATGGNGCLASTGCVAYVGDNTGKLHKFVHVFSGTLAECTATNTTAPCPSPDPWPLTVIAGQTLTSPVLDTASNNIFVGAGNGILYYLREVGSTLGTCASGSPPCLGSTTVAVGTAAMLDSPIVDSTTQKVFATANNGTNAILAQADTQLSAASVVSATMGIRGNNLYDGAFDNAYFTSVATGHMYFCGTNTAARYPALYRVGFNAAGTMNAANDGNSFQLTTNNAGIPCTPLTEIYNSTQGVDWLFLAVTNHGETTTTPNCGGTQCLMSFNISSAFPTAPYATFKPAGTGGLSGLVIDNISGDTTGSSSANIYYEDITGKTAVKVTQSGLK